MTEPNAANAKLPILAIFKAAVRFPCERWITLMRLGWPLALATILMSMVGTLVFPSPSWIGQAPQLNAKMLLLLPPYLIVLALGIVFSIAWTRVTFGLLESQVRLQFESREWLYLRIGLLFILGPILFSCAVMVIAVLMMHSMVHSAGIPLTIFGLIILALLGLGLVVVDFTVWARLLVLFPAIAVDRYAGLKVAWRQTVGQIWPISAILGLITLAFLAAELLIGVLYGMAIAIFSTPPSPLIVGSLDGVISFLFSAFSVTALALIYLKLAEPHEPANAAAIAE